MLTIKYLKDYFEHAATAQHMDFMSTDVITTDKLDVFAAYIGINPISPYYGRIIGYFVKDEQYYRFIYNVHRPKQCGANISNKMVGLSKVTEVNGYVCTDSEVSQDWCYAFYSDYKMSDLEKETLENAIALRELTSKITAYSRENKLCEKLRKTDKVALQVNPMYSAQ